jgi:hypothetical protein
MKHKLKSFIVGNSVLLAFYIFMVSNAWAMPPEWYIRCDMDCNYEPGGSLCYCTCMYENWEPFPMGFPAPGPDADGDFYQDTDSGYGICIDNCPGYYNPLQEDADNDGIGDACDDKICNIVIAEGYTVVPTNETSRTQQATLEALQAIPDKTENPGWDGACYVGEMMAIQFIVCQDGSARYWGMVGGGSFSWDVVCGPDNDNDGMINLYDNCPDTYNLNQEDVDNDAIGDVCDPDTIYGTILGAVQGGITVNIETYSCGTATLVATITTNAEGYYAVGGLEKDTYGIIPHYSNYTFSPKTRILRVPQTNIRSYNFTATED